MRLPEVHLFNTGFFPKALSRGSCIYERGPQNVTSPIRSGGWWISKVTSRRHPASPPKICLRRPTGGHLPCYFFYMEIKWCPEGKLVVCARTLRCKVRKEGSVAGKPSGKKTGFQFGIAPPKKISSSDLLFLQTAGKQHVCSAQVAKLAFVVFCRRPENCKKLLGKSVVDFE